MLQNQSIRDIKKFQRIYNSETTLYVIKICKYIYILLNDQSNDRERTNNNKWKRIKISFLNKSHGMNLITVPKLNLSRYIHMDS